MVHASADTLATPQDYLRRMDRDGDGRVDVHENQLHLSRGFHALDRDANGVLDATELPANGRVRGPLTLAQRQAALAAAFERQDLDRNGYLDAAELAAPPR